MPSIARPRWLVAITGGSRRHRRGTPLDVAGPDLGTQIEAGPASQDWASSSAVFVRVRGDRRSWWYFAAFMVALGLVLGIPLGLLAMAAGEVASHDLWVVDIGGSVVMLVYALAWAPWWLAVTSRTEYIVTSTHLEARRGRRTLVALPLSEIEEFEIEDMMDPWSIMWAVRPPPDWPRGRVYFQDDRSRGLPPIMLWGSYAVAQAESAIRTAIRTARGEGGSRRAE